MKKILSTVAALGFSLYLPAAALAGAAASSNDAILRELQELRAQVSSQQAEIDMLKEQKVGDTTGLDTRIEALEAKKGFVVSGNEFIDQIKVNGAMLIRYDVRDRNMKNSNNDDTRARFQNFFRVGGVWENKAENWEVGAGLATGTTSPTTVNDTWGDTDIFKTGDIRLDYAYAKHKWNDVSATLGQMPNNPYKSSWVMVDTDVRMTGLTLAYGQKEGVFATGGGYAVKLVNDDDTSTLYMGQVGYSGKFSDKGSFTVATGYRAFSNELYTDDEAVKYGFGSIDPNNYEMNIGDIYGDVSLPAGPVNLKLYGQLWQNFGADGNIGQSQAGSSFPETPGDNDLGWILGADSSYNNFKFGVAYAYIEADSTFGYLGDGTYTGSLSRTNVEGPRVQVGYDMSKNWSTTLSFFNLERIEDWKAAKEDRTNVYQCDIVYKF